MISINRKAGLLAACALIVAACAGCVDKSGPSASSSPPTAAAVSSPSPLEPPSGIDPEKFIPAVESYFSDLNSKNSGAGDLTAKISVSGIIGFVDVTFADLTLWPRFTDAEKKEYITVLGKALDEIAIASAYPGTIYRVGTDTTLNYPGGRMLAERTSLGIVKLF